MALCVLLGCAINAFAQREVITSTQATDKRARVAVPVFGSADPSLTATAQEMSEVMAFDLDFSGVCAVIPKGEFPAAFTGFDADVNKVDRGIWLGSKAEYLVYGFVRVEGQECVCQFRLFAISTREQVVGQELRVDKKFPRLAPHRFSEEIIRYLDGVAGIGTTQIVFTAGQSGKKELYIADYDGANAQPLTKYGSISIKPRVSPDGNKIAFVSYKDRFPFLYIFDRRSGMSSVLSKEPGLNSSPSWSPDGKRVAMTLSKDTNTEIYVKDADGKNAIRLTRNRFSDTSPCFSPDGSQIAFVSDRGGKPQVYVMSASGGDASPLSSQGGNSFDPAWSPDGKKIAYVVERGGFNIWVMNSDGSGAMQYTDQGVNESPTWSPDSRHVAFSTNRRGKSEVWALTLSTGQQYPLSKLNMECEGPSWSRRR
jgi:TolB protein